MGRKELLEKIIAELPSDKQCDEGKEKACANCYNYSQTLIPLGLYWAERRCHYCERYSNWSHVKNLLDEIKEGKLADKI